MEKTRVNLLGTITANGIDAYKAVELLLESDGEEVTLDKEFFRNEYEKIQYDDDFYYVFKLKEGMRIYKELPPVRDDNIFQWKFMKRGDNRLLWCCVDTVTNFKFNITYRLYSGDTRISIVFKYDGRNTEVGCRWVRYSDNEKILEEIYDILDGFNYSKDCVLDKGRKNPFKRDYTKGINR